MLYKFFPCLLRLPRRLRQIFYIYWNRIKFRIYGVHYGHNMCVYNKMYITIHHSSLVSIGNNFVFTNGEFFNPLCRNIRGGIYAAPNAHIKIGNNVGLSSTCIWANHSISIGNFVNIGGDCILLDTDAHNLNYKVRRRPKDYQTANKFPIVIEDDVLIGTRCIVLKGVTIGARSVIGSGSVVTKSIPSDCIAAGNPCRVIRFINQDDNK